MPHFLVLVLPQASAPFGSLVVEGEPRARADPRLHCGRRVRGLARAVEKEVRMSDSESKMPIKWGIRVCR